MNQPDAKSIFGQAGEILDPVARAAYLDNACAGQPDVRAEIETLLRAQGPIGFVYGESPGILGCDV